MYTYEFPIGDWSDDGHCECEDFLVSGDLPINDVREAHFQCPEKYGFELGDICRDEPKISTRIATILFAYDLLPKDYDPQKSLEPLMVCDLWINILNKINPKLNLKRLKRDPIPTIVFNGFDKKGRHLNNPGYGVFLDY